MPFVIKDIDPKDHNDIKNVFMDLINTVKNSRALYREAKKYNTYCIKKYKKVIDNVMKHAILDLEFAGLCPIVQSSYSANVYIDDSVDLDIVIPYETPEEKEAAFIAAKKLGYTFLETRNVELEHMTHDVFIHKFDIFEIELKIRKWSTYKEHLYKIHKFLDGLDPEIRMIWRYIRSQVIKSESIIQKKVKYLWYMYGAIETGVNINKSYFPMNIYSCL